MAKDEGGGRKKKNKNKMNGRKKLIFSGGF